MPQPQARYQDFTFGICYAHIIPISIPGLIINGSPDSFTDTKANARRGDLVLSFCNHISVIITGSPSVFTNAPNNARVNDAFFGPYVGTIIVGSPTRKIQ